MVAPQPRLTLARRPDMTTTHDTGLSRRQLLRQAAAMVSTGLAGAAFGPVARAQPADHAPMGPVEPRRAAPSLSLTLHDGRTTSLHALLQGRVTAVQLMFTGCSATCPVQGAIFAALQGRLDTDARGQLLSLSIDPLGDDAAALARWRQRFGAGPRWLAGVPPVSQVDRLLDFLGGRLARRADRHTPQVALFDSQGRLAFRCAELAGAADIARALGELQRRG